MTIIRKISVWLIKFENLIQEMNKSERDMLRTMIDAVFATYDEEEHKDAV